MTFTYTGPNSDAEKIRLRIGDTVEQTYSVTDEEIAHALTEYSAIASAAVLTHEWFLSRLADYISSSTAGQTVQMQQRFDMHMRLHDKLVARAGRGEMHCYAGGISQDRIDDAKEDTDYPQPFARVGGDDYPGTSDNDATED